MLPIALLLLLLGCAHAISQQTREAANQEITVTELFADPDAFRGETVILGGMIVNSTNESDGAYIEVLQLPLDYRGRPDRDDESAGRFLAFDEEYLETAIYAPGRLLAVAGVVQGRSIRPLGEIEYSYPVIRIIELRLLKSRPGPTLHFGFGVFHGF